ncbi:Na+/H+ antiporter NhaA, partial [Georgenia sp. 10Sc9-8]|nr:Na+/H+ antiporter NhaA [Georgenia halotolerans]
YRPFFGLNAAAAWVILLPLGIVFWALVHASGIHATVAGVLLGFAIPVVRSQASGGPTAGPGMSEIFEHRFRPLSAGFAVPVFAFFSAGVAVGGWDGLVSAASEPVVLGIVLGLVVGKPLGIVGTTWLLTKVTRVRLDPALRWVDLVGVALLAGIGFTVSLLIADLSFDVDSLTNDHAKVGILSASILAALLASGILRARNAQYRRMEAEEAVDTDRDGIPDVYEHSAGEDDETLTAPEPQPEGDTRRARQRADEGPA